MSVNGEPGIDSQSLSELIGELSLQAMMPDTSVDSHLEMLRRITEGAEKAGCVKIGEAASALASAIGDRGSADLKALETVLSGGITALQACAEEETRPKSSPAGDSAADASLAQDPELLSEFILESREHLASIEKQLLVLEREPGQLEALNSVFRSFHTIKGLAGFLDLTEINLVSHEVETALDLARNSKLAVTPPVIDVVLESADYLGRSIDQVEARLQGKENVFEASHEELLSRVRGLTSQDEGKPAPLREVKPPENEAGHPALPAVPEAEINKQSRAAEASALRVDTNRLDYLMEMVGEMVIAQSLVRHNPALIDNKDPRLATDLAQLMRITSEVQKTAMAMRMVPIGNTFKRMARLVRDLSRKLGKQVELVVSGDDTELDKAIAEELVDPLMHMVRNTLDHGIETAGERREAGKNPMGSLRLAAYHQGGQIVIEVADDGRGLNRKKIMEKAVQRRIVDEGAVLTDEQVFNLIFEPGFSTAEAVTAVSGRGVGMDVVRRHVQKLRGRIEVQSAAGRGSRFLLKLPLTLAIIEGLEVEVGQNRYIVPIYAVREMLRPTPGAISTLKNENTMVMIRDRLLPVVGLYRRFRVEPRVTDPSKALLVVVEDDGYPFCLMVDDVIGKLEVVIKNLGEDLKNVPGIAGGAILGDGRVGLILDVHRLFRSDTAGPAGQTGCG